jgi:hypothetical protein
MRVANGLMYGCPTNVAQPGSQPDLREKLRRPVTSTLGGMRMTSAIPQIATEWDYPNELLDAAREMVANSRYEVAVITAQMACEICAERVIRVYFQRKKVAFLETAIEDVLPSYNLANDKVRRVYVA